jgi:hypothetical protein
MHSGTGPLRCQEGEYGPRSGALPKDPLSWKSFGLRVVYFLFNFVVLHIDVIPLDQSGT